MAARKELTLAERVQVIEYAQNNPGVGLRSIAERFRCGRTQIQKILSQKETILMDYAAMNVPSSRKRCRVPTYADVNNAMYEGSEIFPLPGLCYKRKFSKLLVV